MSPASLNGGGLVKSHRSGAERGGSESGVTVKDMPVVPFARRPVFGVERV